MSPTHSSEPRYRLPLFPLPVVLMPGCRMPLHIFEPRYQDLIRDCLREDRGFGMIFHDWDRRGPFLSEPGRIGCIAEIRSHQPLENGRSLVVVEGTGRFEISDGLESEALYFEAVVTAFEDATAPTETELVTRRQQSIDLFQRVLDTLSEPPADPPEFNAGAEASFPLAQTIQIEPSWHQHLLETRDEARRLALVDNVFRAVLE